MKRSVKIASALVVLVLMLAQVIGVSAAVVTTYTLLHEDRQHRFDRYG